MKAFQPKVMVNLMVDYDYWISKEAKDPASSHISQIEFWDKYSRSTKSEVNIQTFTGFDPLKLAVEKRLGVTETHFDKLKALYKTQDNTGPKFTASKFIRPWDSGLGIIQRCEIRTLSAQMVWDAVLLICGIMSGMARV